MRRFILITLVLFFASCSKKELKLPLLGVEGIPEIQNHSEVWMFLQVKDKDTTARVNRKNTISATHWIFNIDKHLSLKSICSDINALKQKHAGSVHSVEGMHNYFSYVDTISKKLSLFEFDKTIFNTENKLSMNELRTSSELDLINHTNIHLVFAKNYFYMEGVKYRKQTFKTFLKENLSNSASHFHLNFDENLSYQDYLHYKTTISQFNPEGNAINAIEYIFNKEKVHNCNCD